MRKIISAIAFKKHLTLLLLSVFLFQQNAQPQALPVAAPAANFVMNRAVGAVITRTAVARGFAANDPRIAATLTGASSSLTAVNVVSGVAGVGLGILGAPVWLTIAASLGVLAVGTAIVARNSSISLQNGALLVNGKSTAIPPPYAPVTVVPTDPWQNYRDAGISIYRQSSCYASQACSQYPALPSGSIPYSIDLSSNSTGGAVTLVFWSLNEFTTKYPAALSYSGASYGVYTYSTKYGWASPPTFEVATNGSRRLVGQMTYQVTCDSPGDLCAAVESSPNPSTLSTKGVIYQDFISTDRNIAISNDEGPRIFTSLDTALPNINSATKADLLSDSTLASIVDHAWMQAASQPNYQGLPYSVTQPVTAMDVATWRSANPTAVPTIGDLLAPASNPGTSIVPISPTVTAAEPAPSPNPTPQPDPNTNPSTNPSVGISNVNVVNTPRIDMGADPMTPDPTLEATPTSWQILTPLMVLFPELKNFHTPDHSAECPKPTFQIFDTSIVMDSHCTIAEQFRPQIISVMLTVWILVSLFIVLSA